MVMEPMSEGSTGVREGVERGKLRGGVTRVGEQRGAKRKRGSEEDEAGREGTEVKKKRIRGPKQPNPLSVKKAKKPAVPEDAGKENMRGLRDEDIAEDRPKKQSALQDSDDGAVYKKKRKRKHKPGSTAVVDGVTIEASEQPRN